MIVIFGATGNIGLPLALALAKSGLEVRAFVRNRAKTARLELAGVEICEGDLHRSEDVDRALSGAERVFLNSPIDDAIGRVQTAIVERCVRVGVKHVVRISTPAADPASPLTLGRWHGEIDAALHVSGVPYTLLKPVLFMQNFLNYESVWEEGALYSSSGEGKIGAIDARDIADVAAAVLGASEPPRGDLLLTGPVTLSFAEMARIIGAALGSDVRYQEVTPESAHHYITKGGTPAWLADDLLIMYAMMKHGATDQTVDTVRSITQRTPRTFEAFARDAVARLRGGPLEVLV